MGLNCVSVEPCLRNIHLGIAQALLNRPKLLICDEPTSSLDPVGRKEILDILSAVREQTTVLFSTHILSNVERICTDVAFLKDGIVSIQGPLSQIKSRYRTEEYLLETESEADLHKLLQCIAAFQTVAKQQPFAQQPAISHLSTNSTHQLRFRAPDLALPDVLHLLADQQIPFLKLERMEPTLESLFMEVAPK